MLGHDDLLQLAAEIRAFIVDAVNTHGGQLSEGRTHGFGFIYEAVTQLRHAAGDRQVAGCETAVMTSGGGTPSSVMLLTRGTVS